jgi:putative transposase
MRRLYTDEQIVEKLREEKEGKAARDIMQEMGISERTFYRWKSRYGGLDVTEVKRLKQLEDENARLKGLLADITLENSILKEKLDAIGETLRKNVGPKQAHAVNK